MIHWGTIALLMMLAFGLNVPLGAWRNSLRKFSPAWFLAIHATVPLLFLVRIGLDLSYWVIPPEIAFVIAGQLVGSRLFARPARALAVEESRIGPDS